MWIPIVVIVLIVALLIGFMIVRMYSKPQGQKRVRFQDDSKKTAYFVYSNNCPHCHDFKPKWEKAKNNLNYKTHDVEASHPQAKQLFQKFKIEGFPTVVKIHNGQMDKLVGARSFDDLMRFLQQ